MPPPPADAQPRRRRIGVFGGTFDPPHIGHLITAIDVTEVLDLDVMMLVVANEPWQKTSARDVTDAATRLALVTAAVAGEPRLEVSDVEIRRGGPSYTVDTLTELRALEPDADWYLLVGSDAAAGLASWHRFDELPSLCHIVVVERPGGSTAVPAGIEPLHVAVPRLEISSTELRRRVVDGRSLRHLVPDEVISLIRRSGLYGGRR